MGAVQRADWMGALPSSNQEGRATIKSAAQHEVKVQRAKQHEEDEKKKISNAEYYAR